MLQKRDSIRSNFLSLLNQFYHAMAKSGCKIQTTPNVQGKVSGWHAIDRSQWREGLSAPLGQGLEGKGHGHGARSKEQGEHLSPNWHSHVYHVVLTMLRTSNAHQTPWS